MTDAHFPHPLIRRSAPAVAVALVAIAATSLLLVDGAVAVPAGVSEAAPARPSSDSITEPMDISQQFYREKTVAPAHELPAQF